MHQMTVEGGEKDELVMGGLDDILELVSVQYKHNFPL